MTQLSRFSALVVATVLVSGMSVTSATAGPPIPVICGDFLSVPGGNYRLMDDLVW